MSNTFRYDLASWTEPRVILITDNLGKRSKQPRLGYVVLPSANRPPQPWPSYKMPAMGEDAPRPGESWGDWHKRQPYMK